MESEVEQLLSHANSELAKFEQGNGTDYLGNAIVLDRQAVDLCPPDHPKRWYSLTQLAHHLWHRYNQLGTIADIMEAILVSREVLNILPEEHPNRSTSLHNVAIYLSSRYRGLGAMTDLNEAIVLARHALDLCPLGHPEYSMTLNNVANRLSDRYRQFGTMSDLNEAIFLARRALEMCPPEHSGRSISSNNIANHLSDRYKQLGAIRDINEAIALAQKALDLLPPGHPHRSGPLNNVASHLSDRYRRLGETKDLDKAIVLARQALDLCPPGHMDHSVSLNNVANRLSIRFRQSRSMVDLGEAIMLGRKAIDHCPPGHPDRAMSLVNIARCLSDRYDELGKTSDLNEAIIFAREALDLHPSYHPERSLALDQLAGYIRIRFTKFNASKDKEDLFSLYAELSHVPQIVSSSDLFAARQWVSVAEEFRHPTTILAYETSLRLLTQHLATFPSLPQHLQILKYLTSSLAVDAFSACLRGRCSEKAVELLEQGRGVFWNQMTRFRSPLDDVIALGPTGKTLVDEFSQLTSHIHDVIDSDGSDRHDKMWGLNLDLQAVIINIRKLPGLARFLFPSIFSDLKHAASGGPVIIVNASKYSCDTLVVFFDRNPIHIPLQITRSRVLDLSSELQSLTLGAKIMDVTRGLARFLRDLWDEVVSPIVDFLQTTLPSQSRIWWCPTAEFSLLPLHAAGPYRKGQRNLSHLYISSYTPTLTALIRARRNTTSTKCSESVKGKRLLAIGQANTNGESQLVSVGSELDIVCERLQGHATLTRLEGPESGIFRVSNELRNHQWVHFACHGLPNTKDPFESAFALHDSRFTIERIIRCNLESQYPEFAYLSACHTTVGDEESPDEVIHLASAMQFAGFRSVIGTMWAVDDEQTNRIASAFYKHMVDGESGELDHTRAAEALNRTMNTLVDISLDQRVLYVHIGA